MIDKRKKVIGIMLEEINLDFSNELIKSISNSIPANQDIRLVTFAGKYYDGSNISDNDQNFRNTYNSIFGLGTVCDLDGFIIHLGSMNEFRKKLINDIFLGRLKDVPKVFISSDIQNETVISYDNESGIREAIDYLVNVDGFSRICMLGGRDDNIDAINRKDILRKCLWENGITFTDQNFEMTDMSDNCIKEANRLLDNNPNVQAIFCVNDSTAKALYYVMDERGLVPGRDIIVFGFDNTKLASEMVPPLASIGVQSNDIGKIALETLLNKINGKEVSSCLVPTRLYGRESLPYEMYDYNTREMLKGNTAFIERMFNDCFYRYGKEKIGSENIDLKRLFYEFISRMLRSIRDRYMSTETFEEIEYMIDVFFDNGAMDYTDALKLVKSVEKLQNSMNFMQKSVAANVMNNRLFLRMKDKAICALARKNAYEKEVIAKRNSLFNDFMVACMSNEYDNFDSIVRNMDKLELKNAALYIYEYPTIYEDELTFKYPENIHLRCVIRAGELHIMPSDRQQCTIEEILKRNEISSKSNNYTMIPIFYNRTLYGLLMCELTDDMYERAEFLSLQLGKTFFVNECMQRK